MIKKKNNFFGANPTINRMDNFTDAFNYNFTDIDTATYNGIFSKLAYFIAVLCIGIGAFFYMHHYFGIHGYQGVVQNGVTVFFCERTIIGVVGIITLISGLVAAFWTESTPVTGTVYCVGSGFSLALISYLYAAVYRGIVFEAIVLTILIVAVMALLYTNKIIRVTSKFKTIFLTTIIVSLISSAIFSLMCIFAPNNPIVLSILRFQNGPLGFIFPLVGVFFGCCFLLMDFDAISYAVENRLNKKYEWYCSFSLILSIIYIYVKVLELLAKLNDRKN